MIASCDPARAERDGGRGVTLGRFRDDILLWKTFEQIANTFLLFNIGKNENAFGRNKALQARDRLLEQSSFGNETQQLLGTVSPAQRPKTLTAAAGKNERINRIRHVRSCQ